jgi:hypothetical protein
VALVTIVGSRGQDDFARAAIEADHGSEMPARLLDAARRTSALRQLDHSCNGFLLASHDASPLIRARSAFHAIKASRQKRGADLLGKDLIGPGELVSAMRRAVRASDVPPNWIGCGM